MPRLSLSRQICLRMAVVKGTSWPGRDATVSVGLVSPWDPMGGTVGHLGLSRILHRPLGVGMSAPCLLVFFCSPITSAAGTTFYPTDLLVHWLWCHKQWMWHQHPGRLSGIKWLNLGMSITHPSSKWLRENIGQIYLTWDLPFCFLQPASARKAP